MAASTSTCALPSSRWAAAYSSLVPSQLLSATSKPLAAAGAAQVLQHNASTAAAPEMWPCNAAPLIRPTADLRPTREPGANEIAIWPYSLSEAARHNRSDREPSCAVFEPSAPPVTTP